jgi:hypothetical protein
MVGPVGESAGSVEEISAAGMLASPRTRISPDPSALGLFCAEGICPTGNAPPDGLTEGICPTGNAPPDRLMPVHCPLIKKRTPMHIAATTNIIITMMMVFLIANDY